VYLAVETARHQLPDGQIADRSRTLAGADDSDGSGLEHWVE
jgi:hypothetical protein